MNITHYSDYSVNTGILEEETAPKYTALATGESTTDVHSVIRRMGKFGLISKTWSKPYKNECNTLHAGAP